MKKDKLTAVAGEEVAVGQGVDVLRREDGAVPLETALTPVAVISGVDQAVVLRCDYLLLVESF